MSMTDKPQSDRILEEAIAAHRSGDIDGAYGVYRQILTEQPDHAGARHMVGVVYLQQGRLSDAEEEIRRAIASDSGVVRYHQNLAVALTEQKRFEEALGALESALDVDPTNREATFATAGLMLLLARPIEAEDILRGLIAKDPGDAAALANLASALGMQNKAVEAVELCQQALEHHPREANLWINLAGALDLLNDLDAAADAAERAIALAPNDEKAQGIVAHVARRRGASQNPQQNS